MYKVFMKKEAYSISRYLNVRVPARLLRRSFSFLYPYGALLSLQRLRSLRRVEDVQLQKRPGYVPGV